VPSDALPPPHVTILGCIRTADHSWIGIPSALENAAANKQLAARIDELTKALEHAQWWANKFHAIYGSQGFRAGPGGSSEPTESDTNQPAK